jgi:beta-galactosidase
MTDASPPPRVKLAPGGLDLGDGRIVPLWAGSVHYWRLDPARWRACLQAVKDLGFRIVDVYVPWGVHEGSAGTFDFGTTDRRLDVVRFLELIGELGMQAIVRPGPHINAELTYFGIPERVIWSRDCQARSPRDNPVMLPMIPVAFPVPSYAAEAFHAESDRWLAAVGPLLSPLRWPEGPIVAVQVDNEGALYFRDGAYDQDYHPDAIALYRRFLAEKYATPEELAAAYGIGPTPFESIEPPRRFDATRADELTRHLDWSEFHEWLLAWSMGRFAQSVRKHGLSGIPTTHNLPFGQETTALNARRLGEHVDLIALDYYHRASPLDREVIARRTSELVVRCDARGEPPFAAEMGSGFPPFFPPLAENDSIFTLLCALAYGLRGFNLYMAVSRDRWIGGPIDPNGVKRPMALVYEKLIAGLDRVAFPTLRRHVPVRLVTPRSLRRLTRVMHAFGPATGALFSVLGVGARERCLEDELGLGGPIAIEGDAFVRAFEQAMSGRGVPFAHVGGEDTDVALEGARWVICATSGGLKPALWDRLVAAARGGALVTIGPRVPTRDGSMRALAKPFDPSELAVVASNPLAAFSAPAEADRAVARAIEQLGLPTFAADPDGVYVTVHENHAGAAKVAFVLNPGGVDVVARVAIPGVEVAEDLLDGTKAHQSRGVLEVRMPPRTIRVLALG